MGPSQNFVWHTNLRHYKPGLVIKYNNEITLVQNKTDLLDISNWFT